MFDTPVVQETFQSLNYQKAFQKRRNWYFPLGIKQLDCSPIRLQDSAISSASWIIGWVFSIFSYRSTFQNGWKKYAFLDFALVEICFICSYQHFFFLTSEFNQSVKQLCLYLFNFSFVNCQRNNSNENIIVTTIVIRHKTNRQKQLS